MHRTALSLLLLLMAAPGKQVHAAAAKTGFEIVSYVLYQQNEELEQRISSDDLATYMKKIEATVAAFLKTAVRPEALDLVVAVRPSRKTKVWFIPSAAYGGKLAALRAQLEAIPAPNVTGGPVVFAGIGSIAGIDRSDQDGLPQPEERLTALKNRPLKDKGPIGLDKMLALAWPNLR